MANVIQDDGGSAVGMLDLKRWYEFKEWVKKTYGAFSWEYQRRIWGKLPSLEEAIKDGVFTKWWTTVKGEKLPTPSGTDTSDDEFYNIVTNTTESLAVIAEKLKKLLSPDEFLAWLEFEDVANPDGTVEHGGKSYFKQGKFSKDGKTVTLPDGTVLSVDVDNTGLVTILGYGEGDTSSGAKKYKYKADGQPETININGYLYPIFEDGTPDYSNNLGKAPVVSSAAKPYPTTPPPTGYHYELDPETGEWNPVYGASEDDDQFQREQFKYQKQQDELDRQTQQNNYLANLRANPASWLEYAAATNTPAVVQPWMLPLNPLDYPQLQVGQILPWGSTITPASNVPQYDPEHPPSSWSASPTSATAPVSSTASYGSGGTNTSSQWMPQTSGGMRNTLQANSDSTATPQLLSGVSGEGLSGNIPLWLQNHPAATGGSSGSGGANLPSSQPWGVPPRQPKPPVDTTSFGALGGTVGMGTTNSDNSSPEYFAYIAAQNEYGTEGNAWQTAYTNFMKLYMAGHYEKDANGDDIFIQDQVDPAALAAARAALEAANQKRDAAYDKTQLAEYAWIVRNGGTPPYPKLLSPTAPTQGTPSAAGWGATPPVATPTPAPVSTTPPSTPVSTPTTPTTGGSPAAGGLVNGYLPGGYAPPLSGVQLPPFLNPSRQYQARLSPSMFQQYLGYQQARTGARPEDTQFKLWSMAPPGGKQFSLGYRR